MVKKILILEDNNDRLAAMQHCLSERFGQFKAVFFQDAAAMRDHCEEHLEAAVLIGLDHDLEMLRGADGRCTDPGTGRDMADYLAGKKPICPVIIHTSNGPAGDGMERVLRDAHWETHRVFPVDDLEWIPTTWFRTVRRAIGKISATD